MIYSLVTFQIKPHKIDEARQHIRQFIDQIKKREPGTVVYKSLEQINTSTGFVHFMAFSDKRAQSLHKNSSYCRSFVEKLYPLCEAKPLDLDYQLNETIGPSN